MRKCVRRNSDCLHEACRRSIRVTGNAELHRRNSKVLRVGTFRFDRRDLTRTISEPCLRGRDLKAGCQERVQTVTASELSWDSNRELPSREKQCGPVRLSGGRRSLSHFAADRSKRHATCESPDKEDGSRVQSRVEWLRSESAASQPIWRRITGALN
jgi:hypothetical protein